MMQVSKTADAIESVSDFSEDWAGAGKRLLNAAEKLAVFAVRNLDPDHMPAALKLAESAANMAHLILATDVTLRGGGAS